MKDKPSSNLLECEEFDLDYLRDLLKERIREATALRNMIRLVETFKMTDTDDGYTEEVDTIKRLIHGQIVNYARRK